MITLSIIIPVYNAEHFLEECLQSVFKQTLTDLEVICVNDGSTDRSIEILEKWKKKEARLLILDQPNLGVSAARNAGLRVADGKYCGFVDADDTVDAMYFELFLDHEKKYDFVSGFLGVIPKRLEVEKEYFKEDLQSLWMKTMLSEDTLNSVCSKVFKTEFLRQEGILFPTDMKLGEDAHFFYQVLSKANTGKTIDVHGKYIYRDNEESATRKVVDDTFFKRMFQEFEFDHKEFYQINLSKQEIRALKTKRLVRAFLAALSLYLRENPNMKYEQRKSIVKTFSRKLTSIQVIPSYLNEFREEINRFERFVLKAIQQQSTSKIMWAYRYAHWRNGIK